MKTGKELTKVKTLEGVKIYDNNGKTLDRYAVVIGEDVYTMSVNALSPQGVNQYGGKFGDVKGHLAGKIVKFESLPQEVQKAIIERMPKFEFPKTLPWGHLNAKGEYTLVESIEDKYAFYEKDIGFSFKHAVKIEEVYFNNDKSKTLIRVQMLSSFCKMNKDTPDRYLICSEAFYRNVQNAIAYLKGETRVYPPKRKPERIREMTAEEINEYVGEKVIETGDEE